jgi:hypothetical protein
MPGAGPVTARQPAPASITSKPQAASRKPQAASRKPQAASRKPLLAVIHHCGVPAADAAEIVDD